MLTQISKKLSIILWLFVGLLSHQILPTFAFLQDDNLAGSILELPFQLSQALTEKSDYLQDRRRLQGLSGLCDAVMDILDVFNPVAENRDCRCSFLRQELTCTYETVSCQGKILPSFTMDFKLGNPTTVNICQEFSESEFEQVCVEAELVRFQYHKCIEATYGGKPCECSACDDGLTLDVDCSAYHPLALTNGCQRVFVQNTCFDFEPIVLEEEDSLALALPSPEPTQQPSTLPSATPTQKPSTVPSSIPSVLPSSEPSSAPTTAPSSHPSSTPSTGPTHSPSNIPTQEPSASPSDIPSDSPSDVPSTVPSSVPTISPSSSLSAIPSKQPSSGATATPSLSPSEPISISSDFTNQEMARQWAQSDPNLRNYSFSKSIQRYSLAKFYFSTTSNNSTQWTNSDDWLSYDVDECQWYSAADEPCLENGDYGILNLASNGLVGPLVPELGWMVSLTHLNLSQNQLSGELPSELGRLRNLVEVDLHSSYLEGTIPTEFGALTTVKTLSLKDNHLRAMIPSELGLLTNAESIELQRNALTGTVPAELCALIAVLGTELHVDCGAVACDCGCLCY